MEITSTHEQRRFGFRLLALGVAVLTLAGCGKGKYSSKETFDQCDVREFSGHEPVKLYYKPIDRRDVEAIKEAIVTSPDILLATARSLHPEEGDETSMLYRIYDTAHDDGNGFLEDFASDYVDNPGDILCQVNPLGSENDKDRETYYDQDGLDLLKRVEAELTKQYPDPR